MPTGIFSAGHAFAVINFCAGAGGAYHGRVTRLQQRLAGSLAGACGLGPDTGLLVAVSGGVDSMVLLRLLQNWNATRGGRLVVGHFNHQLRGRHSDGDEALVRATAASLKLPFTAGRADVKAFAKQSRQSVEMAARQLRHEFLARVARELAIPCVALAHHADDQVELFFLRLLRGAGGEGLAGMKWRSPSPVDPAISLVRPLLEVPKAALAAYARAEKLEFREDASNAALAVPRNRVRHELLPWLRANYQPGLTRAVQRLMELTGAEAELAGDLAAQWLAQRKLATPPPTAFAALPVAVQRRVIQGQLPALGLEPEFELVEQLRTGRGQAVSAGAKVFARCGEDGIVTTLAKSPPVAYQTEARTVKLTRRSGRIAFGVVKLTWERRAAELAPGAMVPEPGREIFDADRVGQTVVLRYWQPGDRFQPLGMPVPVKLQDLFTNAKIPRDQRRERLVAEAGGVIFWVQGLRMAEVFKVGAETRSWLVWRWEE